MYSLISFNGFKVGVWVGTVVALLLGVPTEVSAASPSGQHPSRDQGKAPHIGGHLNNPSPYYPQRSVACREEGTVTFQVRVEATGRPANVKIVKSSGHRRLDAAAYKTVRNQYRFTPATRGGVAIPYIYRFSIQFILPRIDDYDYGALLAEPCLDFIILPSSNDHAEPIVEQLNDQ